ncbi:MAG TPA: sulfatase [Opitutaceae bacterium]|nr:sulfatase [Opitutaceae bacterium]
MKPRTLLVTLVFALVASLGFAAAAPEKKPNILWLIGEDFGPHLACYGTKEVWSPNLDQMARDGVRYTHMYNGMVCSVSRSAFMTGMYATTIGAHNHRTANKQPLPDGVRVLTGWLRDAGYYSANLVELPASCGFRGAGKTDWNFVSADKPFDSSRWEDLKSHQPFYAQLNFQETHRTYHAPKKADPAKVEIPPYYPDHPVTRQDWAEYLDAASELDRKIGTVLEALKQDGLADNTIIVFFGDNGQSHVRGKQFCYEEGHLVPMIIRWAKNFPAPAHFKPGSVDARFLQGIDLAPTMLAVAGAAKPAKMQGRIFLGDRTEPDQQYTFGHRDRCDMTVMRLRTVRDARYRYIRNFTPWVPFLAFNAYKEQQYPVWSLLPKLHAEGKLTPPQAAMCQPTMPEEEFYDLQADPHELNNLAKSTQPAHQAALAKLRGVLTQWIEDTNDQGRRMETLAELTGAEAARFVPARDWRPQPGTKEADQAAAIRAAAKDNPPPVNDAPKKKKKKA